MVEPGLGLAQQGICREAERRHTRAYHRDHYVTKVLFKEWNEKVIELDGDRLNDVEFQGVWSLPYSSEVSIRFGAKK